MSDGKCCVDESFGTAFFGQTNRLVAGQLFLRVFAGKIEPLMMDQKRSV